MRRAIRGRERPETNDEGALVLLERWIDAERATIGVDPDGTAYLDVADRLEVARAAYRARVVDIERDAGIEAPRMLVGTGAEYL